MGFKEVASLDADNAIALGGFNKKTKKDNQKSAEGYYLGSRTVSTKKGDAQLHFLQTPKGNLGVWGKTDMNRKLSAVQPGTMIRITHTGMQTTPNGDMYKYKVEVDKENTIEVEGLAADAGNSSDDNGSEDESYDAGSDDSGNDESDDNAEQDEDEAQAAALAAAEKKAKVEALLNKNKGIRK